MAHTWFLQGDHARVATLRSRIPLHRGDFARRARDVGEALSVLHRDLEQKMQTRMRDFILAARTLIEGTPAESIAAVGASLASDFRDPEGLFYLSRHLAHLNEIGPALDLFERVVASGFSAFQRWPATRGSIPCAGNRRSRGCYSGRRSSIRGR